MQQSSLIESLERQILRGSELASSNAAMIGRMEQDMNEQAEFFMMQQRRLVDDLEKTIDKQIEINRKLRNENSDVVMSSRNQQRSVKEHLQTIARLEALIADQSSAMDTKVYALRKSAESIVAKPPQSAFVDSLSQLFIPQVVSTKKTEEEEGGDGDGSAIRE